MSTDISPGLATIPDTRRTILQYLKMRGEALTDEIAVRLDISAQGVRQHLLAMERDGLVGHDERRDGLGRPKFAYSLTSTGDMLFPRNYADLTNEILGYVEDEDPELLERIFDKRAQRRLAEARKRTIGSSFSEKVQTIARILDEDGYLAEFVAQGDGTFVITEHNCAVLSVALRYGHACSSELAFLQAALPEADVLRIAHRIAGGHVCAYRVKPKTSDW
jgi:DeoR family transcriptional regulator, suf operon transcriptional repressor